MSKGVEELKRELLECHAEVPKMVELRGKISMLLSQKMATGNVLKRLEEQGTQLDKDIENYKHMLEEADDLKKSWEKEMGCNYADDTVINCNKKCNCSHLARPHSNTCLPSNTGSREIPLIIFAKNKAFGETIS